MNAQLNQFLVDFFSENNCRILENKDGKMRIALTEELDLALMNRPFYWHYVKSIGQQGEPKILALHTNPDVNSKESEWIHYGSPRLQQIWDYLIKKEKFVRLFQEMSTSKNTALYPWLLTNIKIQYKGTQTKEDIISLGIQLMSGKVIVNMMDELSQLELSQTISDFCFTLTPLITLQSGYLRLEKIIEDYIISQPLEWVGTTTKYLAEELALLDHFYKTNSDNPLYEKEKQEIEERYQPEVKITIINGGLIYLDASF